MKLLDRFLERYGAWVMAVALAVITVLLMNPHPADLLGSLLVWAYVAPVILVVLIAILIVRKLRRSEREQGDTLESGE